MMARKFLWIVAVVAGLVIIAAFIWRIFGAELMETAFVPTMDFAESPLAAPPDYAKDIGWVARPGMEPNPALWVPPGNRPAPRPAASAFFIPPTAWLGRSRWNAPLDDPETNDRLALFTRVQASTFNGVADIWVPRYRQATFGSFLVEAPAAEQALDLAYTDVLAAFAAFLKNNPGDGPIILAGHSQGARHLLHLLGGLPADVRARVVAVYAVGWPVALPGDLQRTGGLPACATAEQAGCILSWQSFAADGDLAEALAGFARVRTLDGSRIGTRPMLCVNPLSGTGAAAGADGNLGTLIADALQPGRAGARCSDRGLLLIDPAPKDIGPYVLPGGNFHAYDYSLFWANIRADVETRLSAFAAARAPGAQPPAG